MPDVLTNFADPRASRMHAPDTRHFDESSIIALPPVGETALLASVQLESRFAGQLEHFSQFTDVQAREPERVETPELQWLLRVNGRPLAPYIDVRLILNPWGFGNCFALQLKLDRGSRLEFLVRRLPGPTTVTRLGGRLAGRLWFDQG